VRRSHVRLADVADIETLARAFWRASRGKRGGAPAGRLAANLDVELAQLGAEILDGSVSLGRASVFQIHDPKPRWIHAPCFRERIVHHALMEHLGPVLDRTLIADTFACRAGKGSLAATMRAQQHVRRYAWYVKTDVRAYFASIDHAILRAALRRMIRDPGLLALCDRIIAAHEAGPGRGLPIGALCSQHFANFYLGPLDRHLLEALQVQGVVRYMDDVVAWCESRQRAREVLASVRDFVREHLGLELRPSSQIQRSACGLSFLGFRVLPGTRRLSRRRRRRYAQARLGLEASFARGAIDARGLQAGSSAALAITAHADAAAWCREQLRRRPPPDV